MYELLMAAFGPQYWWPADTPFEVGIGAILTQQTTWKSVQQAIINLKRRDILSASKLSEARRSAIEACTRPTGFYRQKAKRLKLFAQYICRQYRGSLTVWMKSKPMPCLREELLNLDGVGKETADSILLHAGMHPVFVVDSYTLRILKRLGYGEKKYEQARALFEGHLPKKVKVYQEMHALMVELAKRHCRTKPVCRNCPIEGMCRKIV